MQDEPDDELDEILLKLKLDYLTECGSRGGNETGWLAYVQAARANDAELRRAMDEAMICRVAEEVWNEDGDGFNPDAGMSYA
jgi:hypothetical protein